MATRQPQAPGGRKIRHVVLVTSEQEERLQALAKAQNVSVSRLLVESVLDIPPDMSTALAKQVLGLRKQLANGGLTKFEGALTELLEK